MIATWLCAEYLEYHHIEDYTTLFNRCHACKTGFSVSSIQMQGNCFKYSVTVFTKIIFKYYDYTSMISIITFVGNKTTFGRYIIDFYKYLNKNEDAMILHSQGF